MILMEYCLTIEIMWFIQDTTSDNDAPMITKPPDNSSSVHRASDNLTEDVQAIVPIILVPNIPNTVTTPAVDSVVEEFQGAPGPTAGSIPTSIPLFHAISGLSGSAEAVPVVVAVAETEDEDEDEDKSGSLNKVDGARIDALNVLARVVDCITLIDGDTTHRAERAERVESAIMVSEQALRSISRNEDSIAPIITLTHVSEGALVEKGN